MNRLKTLSHQALALTEYAGLFIIAVSTLIAVGFEIASMIKVGKVQIADLLLLFIYLEVLAMISVYLDSGKLPVRMPIYIAMVALARYLLLDIKNMDTWRVVGVSSATLILALTVLVIRYGHCKFAYDEKSN